MLDRVLIVGAGPSRTDGRARTVPPGHRRPHHRQAGRSPDDVSCRWGADAHARAARPGERDGPAWQTGNRARRRRGILEGKADCRRQQMRNKKQDDRKFLKTMYFRT
jgi:hypothetical protein